jgi:hypothetical protein
MHTHDTYVETLTAAGDLSNKGLSIINYDQGSDVNTLVDGDYNGQKKYVYNADDDVVLVTLSSFSAGDTAEIAVKETNEFVWFDDGSTKSWYAVGEPTIA